MTRRSWALDVAIAVAVAVSGVLEAFWGINATHQQGPGWAEAALYVGTGLLLVFRRRWPLWCLMAIVAVSIAEFAVFGAPEGMGIALPGLIAGYSVARWEERPRTWWGLVLLTVLWTGWSLLDPTSQWPLSIIWLSPWIIAWLLGALVRATLQATEQRRQAREQRASRAVAEERNRIARELHDVLGHSVSVMTVQVSAVRRRLTAEQAAEREALESVETVGREALAEMRRIVGVLREAGAVVDREPSPGLAQLDKMVDKFRAAGLPVELTVSGAPHPLPPGVDLTAYRVVQEGLTNVLRHADSPRRVTVSIEYDAGGLNIAVRDDGNPVVVHEDGHGLIGMRERVSMYGGGLTSGPIPEGGFRLTATLPSPTALSAQPSADRDEASEDDTTTEPMTSSPWQT